MKYDFSTYILNKLNEAGEEPQYDTAEKIKSKLEKFIIDKGKLRYKGEKPGESGDVVGKDTLEEIKDGDGWKEFNKKYGENFKKTIDIINNIDKNKDNNIKEFSKDGFKTLGKTIAYRAALTLLNAESTSGDDFKQAVLDAFKDESEYSIKQLENLDSLLDYSTALKIIKTKKERNEKDKNAKTYTDEAKKLNEYEELLKTPQKYTAIQNIKKEYEKEFKENRDIFENAFTEGMAEQKKDMQDPKYEWKDPVTGLPPKGKKKINMYGDKLFKKLQDLGEKADSWIKNQHGMDYVILKSCSLAIKGLVFGGKTLFKLLSNAYKNSNLKNTMNNKEKLDEVKNKINVFVKEFNEWNNKTSNNKKDEKDKTEEEKKNEENEKKTILMKFAELINTHIIPYYYCKLCIIDSCIENIENKYIIRQENNKWSTFNTSNQKRSIITDNAILANNILDYIIKKLQIPFEKFAEESSTDAFKSIPKDLKYNDSYNKNIVKWIDKVKTPYEDTNVVFDAKKFKTITEVYNNEVIKITFNSYKEFFEYCKKVQPMFKNCKVPALVEQELTIDGDEDAGVPGVITGANQGENKEEQNPEENKEEKENYQKILNSVEEIKNAANAEEIAKNYGDTKDKVDTAVKQIQSNIKDQEKKDFLDTHFQNIEKADTLTKMMYLNTAKSNGLFDSCIAFNDTMNMLLEATDDDNTNGYEEIFKQMVALLNGDSNEEKIKEFQELDNKLKDALKDKIKDDGVKKTLGEDPLAIYSFLNKPKQDNKDEQSKIDNTIEDTKKALEFAEDVKEVFTTEYYDKLKAELKTIYDKIEKICDNNDDKLKAFTDVTIADEIKSDLIPNLWKYKRFLTLISESKSFYYHYFMILLEEENIVDELTKKAQVIKKLLSYENEPDFNKDYKEWREGVNTEFEKFEKIENKDSLKDPVQKLSAMGMYVKNNKNKPEEKKEGEQTNGDKTPDQENGEKDQETKSS